MDYKSLMKFGRILTWLGVGTLIGICSNGEEVIEKFGIVVFLAIVAIVAGLSIVYITKNKAKLQELQASNSKTCPNCGLSITNDCKECPKCNAKF